MSNFYLIYENQTDFVTNLMYVNLLLAVGKSQVTAPCLATISGTNLATRQ